MTNKQTRLKALAESHKAIDELASICYGVIMKCGDIDTNELELNLCPRKLNSHEITPTHDYDDLTFQLFCQAGKEFKSGNYERASVTDSYAHEMFAYGNALRKIRLLHYACRKSESSLIKIARGLRQKLPTILERAVQNLYYPAP